MSNEPMFNIQEKAPLWLVGVFIAVFIFVSYGPPEIVFPFRNAGILLPLDTNISPTHHVTSLVLSGFMHASWTHVLMNSGMIVAFAVISMRGVRAKAAQVEKPPRAALMFMLIFLLGVMGGNLFQWGWWALINETQAGALGASGGASALFATAAWAMGGRARLIKFGMAWGLLNLIAVLLPMLMGQLAWPAHIGGYVIGALVAPYWVKPFSTGFSITR